MLSLRPAGMMLKSVNLLIWFWIWRLGYGAKRFACPIFLATSFYLEHLIWICLMTWILSFVVITLHPDLIEFWICCLTWYVQCTCMKGVCRVVICGFFYVFFMQVSKFGVWGNAWMGGKLGITYITIWLHCWYSVLSCLDFVIPVFSFLSCYRWRPDFRLPKRRWFGLGLCLDEKINLSSLAMHQKCFALLNW